MKLSELLLNRFLYRDNEQSSETQSADSISLDSSDTEPASIPSGGAAQDINTGNVQIDGKQLEPGTYPTTTLDVSNWGWGQTCAFSSTDADTVSWGAGTFTSADGTSYAISAGNTGNMVAKTYIYLSLLDSETVYQTSTTSSDSVGIGKVLIAVAQNGATDATYNLSEASQIVSDNILANTIDASKINVGQLSAISADLGTVTAGSININDRSFINSDGEATFIGVSTLNMKAMTNFETKGRFVTTESSGGTINFGNQGAQLSTSATATSYVKMLWNATDYIFNNEPTFTCTIRMDTIGTLTGRCAIGIGNITIDGNGITEGDGQSFAGFYIRKDAGVVTLMAFQQDEDSNYDFQGNLTTISAGTILELYVKVKSTGVDYYFRKNGGVLSSVITLTDGNPADNVDSYVVFANTNWGTASDFDVMLTCAGYEH